ncbi:MAG: hypothetical protein ABI670_23385 [Chloroflexota bacterium]
MVINQDAPTFCIHVPMFDATDAIQSQRNTVTASGPQVELEISAPVSKFWGLLTGCFRSDVALLLG